MKKVFLTIFLIIFIILQSKSQIKLTVEISNLDNNLGVVFFELRDGKDKFVKGISAKISDKKCIITIDSLKVGEYSFKYFHDENLNEEIDKYWIGIPYEGFGFSNNAKVIFGPPSFEDTIFKISEDTYLICEPLYY